MRPVSGDIRFVRSYPLSSFGHVQNFERTPPDKYVRCVKVSHALVCGLSGSRAVCPVLVRSASCRYPVCVRLSPFDLSCERSTAGQVTEFPGRVPHVYSVIVQPTLCPFLIRYMFVLSVRHYVTRTFVDRSLSVTCSVRMRSLRLPRRSSPPLRRLNIYFSHTFCTRIIKLSKLRIIPILLVRMCTLMRFCVYGSSLNKQKQTKIKTIFYMYSWCLVWL